MQTPEASSRTISARGATGVGVASLLGGMSGYVVLLIAARSMTPEADADFLTFWSLLFWSFGVLGGVQNETTRAVAASAADVARTAPDQRSARVLPTGLAVGCAVALALGASSALWGGRLLGPSWPVLVLALSLAIVAYAGQSALLGAAAGARSWSRYSLLVGAEAVARVALVAVAAALARPGSIQIAAALAALTWVLVTLLDPAARNLSRRRADVPPRAFLAHIGHALLASTASAALVVGFTVLLRATSPAADFHAAAPFILAISVTRAPLLVPLTAYQGVAISYFLTHRDQGARPVGRIVGLVAAVGAAAAAAAWIAGPWVMKALFGPAYWVGGPQLGGLTFAGAALASLTLTGAAVLALGDHRRYATGWVLAGVVALALLLLPMALEPRVVLTLTVGPSVGVVYHAFAIARSGGRTR